MTEPFVVAGCIAKCREWILPKWVAALDGQSLSPEAAFVLVNDTADSTLATLDACSRLVRNIELHYETFNTGDPGSERVAVNGSPRYSTANLALLRNEWVARCLARWPQATHLWSCDSDVLPDSDVLEKLLAADKAVVAAVVRNSTAPGIYNFALSRDEGGPRRTVGAKSEEYVVNRADELFTATMTGACCLYRRDIFELGLRWSDHPRGEDAGLAIQARGLRIPLYVHPQARTSHVQRNGEAWR